MGPKRYHMGPKGSHIGPKRSHMGPEGSHTGPKRSHVGPEGFHMGPKRFPKVPDGIPKWKKVVFRYGGGVQIRVGIECKAPGEGIYILIME